MIGDGWDDEPALRPSGAGDGPARGSSPDPDALRPAQPPAPAGVARVVVVTGSRAEYGLLRPVMRAIAARPALQLRVIAAGSHLVAPATTYREVKRDFAAYIADVVPMQLAGRVGLEEDVESVARGVARFGRAFERLRPSVVVVLGDRIEAFAGAIAASVGGYVLAHLHGGDRAEGVADEAMRHAISKLSHAHYAATEQSAQRLVRMGEDPASVHVVGSPAIDELVGVAPMDDGAFAALGSPTAVLLHHPVGQPHEQEEAGAAALLEALAGERVLALDPNLDPGRAGIVAALDAWCPSEGQTQGGARTRRAHLPREQFVALLARLARCVPAGVLVGNSSAGLIEAAALGVPVVDVGSRQGGRERGPHVRHVPHAHAGSVRAAVAVVRDDHASGRISREHPYGDGRTGPRVAELLEALVRSSPSVRKRCAY